MSKWFMPRNPLQEQSPVRLFCFPYAGGGSAAYRELHRYLPGVTAVQYPGRESRLGEHPLDDMDTLADAVVAEIAPLTDRPYALLGHSLGARVAYEVACRLVAAGYPAPRRLVVAASRTPRMPELHPIHHLGDADFLDGLERFQGTPGELRAHPEILAFFLPMLRADFTISETWIAPQRNPLNLPISVFCGDADDDAPEADMRQWDAFTTEQVAFHLLPGNHFFLFAQIRKVAEVLRNDLMHDLPEWQMAV